MRSLGAEAVETGGQTEAEPRLELEQLYRSYAGTLVARLRRQFGADAAEDIVQEAFIKIGRYSAVAPVRSPKALITRIAINLGLDQTRAPSRSADSRSGGAGNPGRRAHGGGPGRDPAA